MPTKLQVEYRDKLKYLRFHYQKVRKSMGDLIQMFEIFHECNDINAVIPRHFAPHLFAASLFRRFL